MYLVIQVWVLMCFACCVSNHSPRAAHHILMLSEPGPRVLFDKLFDMFLFEIYCLANAFFGKFLSWEPIPLEIAIQTAAKTAVRIQEWRIGSIWTRRKLDSQRWEKTGFPLRGFIGYALEFMGYAWVTHGLPRTGLSRSCGVRTSFVQGFAIFLLVPIPFLWCSYGFHMGSCFSPLQIH